MELDCEGSRITHTPKSSDFNVIAHGEAYVTPWSDTGESTHLTVGSFFGDHITTLNEDNGIFFVS